MSVYSIVFFQMNPQRDYYRVSIVTTLAALLWFFSFSDESLKCLHDRRHSHIGCICVTFCHCVFSNASSKHLPKRMHTHTGCICLIFLCYAFSHELSKCMPHRRNSHWLLVTLVAFIFSTMSFHMFHQRIIACIVTLVAFLLFPLWFFMMHDRISCICWSFSSVCSQMFPKIACLIGCTVTLGAIVGLFPIVCHHMSLQIV